MTGARDTLLDPEDLADDDEVTARVPTFARRLAESIFARAADPASAVFGPQCERDDEDEPTVQSPAYSMQLAIASVTGENVAADERAPDSVAPVSLESAPISCAPMYPDVAPPTPGPSRAPIVASLLVAVASLGFAAMTSLHARAETPSPARIPHTPASNGAHACVAETPARPLALGTTSSVAAPSGTHAAVRPAAQPRRRTIAAPAPRKSPNGRIVRDAPF